MKLLLDANLSWGLVAKLKLHFDDCEHVEKVFASGIAKDIEIWNYAKENNCIIVTNDEDFLNLSGMIGFPPKIVLLKTGNQSNYFLEEIILKHKSDIEALAVSDDYGLIEIF